ncbi:MAG: hypothetical protein R2784_10545 [Saprospiraceae bacterium]
MIAGVPTITTSSVMHGSVTVFDGAFLISLFQVTLLQKPCAAENVTVNLTGTASGSLITRSIRKLQLYSSYRFQ